jgi:hypothetical protein
LKECTACIEAADTPDPEQSGRSNEGASRRLILPALLPEYVGSYLPNVDSPHKSRGTRVTAEWPKRPRRDLLVAFITHLLDEQPLHLESRSAQHIYKRPSRFTRQLTSRSSHSEICPNSHPVTIFT